MQQYYYSLFFLIAGIIYFSIGVISIIDDRGNSIRKSFFWLCIVYAGWAVTTSLMNASGTAAQAANYRTLSAWFFAFSYPLRIVFILRVSQIEKKLFRCKICNLLLFVPAIICIYLCFLVDPFMADSVKRVAEGWSYLYLPSFRTSFIRVYSVVYLTGATLLVVWLYLKPKNLKREKNLYSVLLFGMMLVILFGGMNGQVVSFWGLNDKPPIGLFINIISIVIVYYFIEKYKFMNINMSNIVYEIMDSVEDGVIVVGYNNKITYVNQGLVTLLGLHPDQIIVGEQIQKIVNLPSANDASTLRANETFEVKLEDGRLREIISNYAVIKDDFGDNFGGVYIMKDVTELMEKQRELEAAKENLEQEVANRTRELEEEIEIRKLGEQHLMFIAYNDPSTGLLNRRSIFERASEVLKETPIQSGPDQQRHFLIFIDLNKFKQVNDNFGHAEGDRLLVEVANRLKAVFKGESLVARFGGDEFLIFIKNGTREKVQDYIQRLYDKMNEVYYLGGEEYQISLSLGVSQFPEDGTNLDKLIQNADARMYSDKQRQNEQTTVVRHRE